MHLKLMIDDPTVIERLARTRETTVTILRTDPAFTLEDHPGPGHPALRWERVRLVGERIYLNAAAILDIHAPVKIELSTSGHYSDEYRDSGPLEYVSGDARHPFEYVPADDREDPVADARDAQGFSYFEPTPFTTWTIRILNDESALNLKGLENLTFELFGSWSMSKV
jgi:hypothetical protein